MQKNRTADPKQNAQIIDGSDSSNSSSDNDRELISTGIQSGNCKMKRVLTKENVALKAENSALKLENQQMKEKSVAANGKICFFSLNIKRTMYINLSFSCKIIAMYMYVYYIYFIMVSWMVTHCVYLECQRVTDIT